MAEKKYIGFIEKLIKQTKANELEWAYLDSYDPLFKNMRWTDNFIEMPNFDTEKSFFTNINSYYVVLLTDMNSFTDLYVVPSTYKNVRVLKAEEYGEYTTRLYNLVRSRFPDAEAFITKFLNET